MTDSQLVLKIRQIESSPTGHQPFKIQQMVQRNLAELRAEARRRGLI